MIEHWEGLEAQRQDLALEQKAALARAKSDGLDVKAIKALIKRRKTDPEELEAFESLVALYEGLVELAGTPLGEWARKPAGGGDDASDSDGDIAKAQGISRVDARTLEAIRESRTLNAGRSTRGKRPPKGEGQGA